MSDLSNKWIYCEMERQVTAKKAVEASFRLLQNQNTPYARGHMKMAEVRSKIIHLLADSL